MSQYLKYQIGEIVGPVHFVRTRLRPRPRHLLKPVVNPTWFVVATNPRCEERAKQGLEALGYRVFLPTETVWLKVPPHRQKAKGCKKEKVERPLFRGYLFLGLERGLHPFEPALLTDGVAGIIRSGGEYLPVPAARIDGLMTSVSTGDHDQTAKEVKKLADIIGQQVTIMEGPLLGFVATVLKAASETLHLEIEAFGKRIKLQMDLETVQPV